MTMNDNFNPITIDEKICNGCGNCVFICGMGVIEMKDKPGSVSGKIASASKPEYCMTCETCVKGCKRKAITLNIYPDSFGI